MAQELDDGLVSVEEYLEMEERSEIRHEYVGAMLYAKGGGSDRHNRIVINIVHKPADVVDGSPCRVYINDMRVKVGNNFYYPDVIVA